MAKNVKGLIGWVALINLIGGRSRTSLIKLKKPNKRNKFDRKTLNFNQYAIQKVMLRE